MSYRGNAVSLWDCGELFCDKIGKIPAFAGMTWKMVWFFLDFFVGGRIITGYFANCPNSLVVKHVLGKDESQVRFLLRAPLKNSPVKNR